MADSTETTPEVPRSEVHTYPDGSSVVGSPPWPKKSPLQRAAEALESVGAPAEPDSPMVTADNVTAAPSRKR